MANILEIDIVFLLFSCLMLDVDAAGAAQIMMID